MTDASKESEPVRLATLEEEAASFRQSWMEAERRAEEMQRLLEVEVAKRIVADEAYRTVSKLAERFSSERDALAERVKMLEAALGDVRPLVSACYEEMHGATCDDEPDNGHVASTLNEYGVVVPAGSITFGMIRRARAAVEGGE